MTALNQGTGGFLNPNKIIEEINLIKEGMKIADFGCGHGYFAIPLAKKIGDTGKIYAFDILPEALEGIHSRMKLEGIENIETKRVNLEKEEATGLIDNFCDIVFIANLLFQTEKDELIIKEAKRILKKNGYLVFIDWKPEVSLGPKGKRVSQKEIKSLIEKLDLKFEKEFFTDNYHFGLIFKKD